MKNHARALIVILAVALPWLVVLPDVGRLPHNDYYTIVGQLVDDGGTALTASPARWLTMKSNEHTVLIPALLYGANIQLFDGDNRALSAFALLMFLVELNLIVRLLPGEVRRDRLLLVPVVAGLAVLVLAPAGAHSIVMGFSGTIWLTANVFAIAAISSIARQEDRSGVPWLALLFGVLAALSYSTNLGLWPALLVGAALCGVRWRGWLALVAAMAAVCAFELLLYTRPTHHAAPVFSDVRTLVRFVLVYLGNPFAAEAFPAATVGMLGLVATGAAIVWILRRGERVQRVHVAPWVMLQVYVLANALGTSSARAGFAGPRQSRYVCIAALFWVALLVQALLILRERGLFSGWSDRRTCAVGAVVLAVVVWVRGAPTMHQYLDGARWQPLAEVALRRELDDQDVLRRVSPATHEIVALRPFLRATGHVPFDRPESIAPAARVETPCEDIELLLQNRVRLDDRVVRLSIALFGPTPAQPAPRLVDEYGSGVGVVVPRPAPPFSGADLFPGERQWAGYALAPAQGGVLGLAVPRLDGTWCAISVPVE